MTGDNSEVLLELDTIFNQAFGITKTWKKKVMPMSTIK